MSKDFKIQTLHNNILQSSTSRRQFLNAEQKRVLGRTRQVSHSHKAQTYSSGHEKRTSTKEINTENAWLKLEDFVSLNPVMGRVFIELTGDGINSITSILMGRSPLFALENTIAPLIWASFGVTFPVFVIKNLLVGKGSNYTKWLKNKHEMDNEKPLELPFAKLDEHYLQDESHRMALTKELGLKNEKELLPTARLIRRGKLLGMTFDMFALATVSTCIYYIRNWLTWILSGKKEGFSGEFTYATDEYVKKKADELKKDEAWRHALGVIVGFIGNLSAPLLSYLILRNPNASSLKKAIPGMEYTQGIYMNRWLMVFHVLFNYNFKQIFAFARSTNEMLESIVKTAGFDFLFFIGDDLIAGQTAKYFEKKHKAELDGIVLTHKGPLGVTLAKPMHIIEKEIENHPNPKLKELVNKLSRYNFRSGLLATSALLGVFLSVVNAVQTKKNIQNEGGEKTEGKS